MSHWTDEYRRMIEACGKQPARLSDWDSKFLNSLLEQLDERASLTGPQISKLEEVWERVTRGGCINTERSFVDDLMQPDMFGGRAKCITLTPAQLATALESEGPK